ncbi:uncharacterized protein [Diadema setosum]|uniref:uncharacterized protein n=1 Tax=Diadema setosum TaxID=31175 RepID=UPI003B3A8861
MFCDFPGDISNGRWNSTETSLGSSISLTCDDSYVINGSVTLQCIRSSDSNLPVWNASLPTCQSVESMSWGNRLKCGYPGNVSHGKWGSNITQLGSTVTLDCDDGYVVNGSATLLCVASSNDNPLTYTPVWNASTPSCQEVDRNVSNCGNPGNVSHGTWGINTTLLGSTVTLNCDEGYVPNGSATLLCVTSPGGSRSTHALVWNASTPSCIAVEGASQPSQGITRMRMITVTSSAGWDGSMRREWYIRKATITGSVVVGLLLFALIGTSILRKFIKKRSTNIRYHYAVAKVSRQKDTSISSSSSSLSHQDVRIKDGQEKELYVGMSGTMKKKYEVDVKLPRSTKNGEDNNELDGDDYLLPSVNLTKVKTCQPQASRKETDADGNGNRRSLTSDQSASILETHHPNYMNIVSTEKRGQRRQREMFEVDKAGCPDVETKSGETAPYQPTIQEPQDHHDFADIRRNEKRDPLAKDLNDPLCSTSIHSGKPIEISELDENGYLVPEANPNSTTLDQSTANQEAQDNPEYANIRRNEKQDPLATPLNDPLLYSPSIHPDKPIEMPDLDENGCLVLEAIPNETTLDQLTANQETQDHSKYANIRTNNKRNSLSTPLNDPLYSASIYPDKPREMPELDEKGYLGLEVNPNETTPDQLTANQETQDHSEYANIRTNKKRNSLATPLNDPLYSASIYPDKPREVPELDEKGYLVLEANPDEITPDQSTTKQETQDNPEYANIRRNEKFDSLATPQNDPLYSTSIYYDKLRVTPELDEKGYLVLETNHDGATPDQSPAKQEMQEYPEYANIRGNEKRDYLATPLNDLLYSASIYPDKPREMPELDENSYLVLEANPDETPPDQSTANREKQDHPEYANIRRNKKRGALANSSE